MIFLLSLPLTIRPSDCCPSKIIILSLSINFIKTKKDIISSIDMISLLLYRVLQKYLNDGGME